MRECKQLTSLLEHATRLTQHGFSVIPTKNKIPVIRSWTARRRMLATDEELVAWFSNGRADGIAIPINDTEFAIDTDGTCGSLFMKKVVARLTEKLQEAVNNTTHTKTPNGDHWLFKIDSKDFPEGIKERAYVKLNHHREIALKGRNHLLVERGPGYEIIKDIDSVVTLRKDQVDELLKTLETVKAEINGVNAIVGILLPYYTSGRRDKVVFTSSGYLHKNGVAESLISEVVESLASQTKDEELQARLRVVKDTCDKDPDSHHVSGYDQLLEALENNHKPVEEIGQVLNELGFRGFSSYRKSNHQDQMSERTEDSEERQLAATKLTRQDIDFAINIIIKEAKYDELSIKQILHGFNSTFTKTPMPHVINSKDSGAGKSYILNHVANFYPDKYILSLAGLSDKAIFHSDGLMVLEDETTGGLKPLDSIIDDLEIELEELQNKNERGNKKRIKEIESEIRSLQRKAQKLIDLNNRIIIPQDTPSESVFNVLMSLLGQDSPKDQIYAFTDKTSGSGKLIQSRNRIRGMPVIFSTQVMDDTNYQRFEEKNRRFIQVTPNTSKEKIREANRLTALRYGYLPNEYEHLVVSSADIERTKQIIKIVIAKLKYHSKYLQPKKTGVKVPFAQTLMQSLPDDGRVWEMTVAERTMKYLSMVTKLYMDDRPRIVDKRTGAFYPISTFEDLKETLALMKRAGSNLRPYLTDWYDSVFLSAYKDQNDTPKTGENDIGIQMKEIIVGVTTEELAEKTAQVMNCVKPGIDEIRKKYLDPLINQGIINKDQSRINTKHNVYSPVNKKFHAHREEVSKVRVSDPALFPNKNLLEQSFDKVFGYDEDGVIKNNNILVDETGQEITLDKLLETYFVNPGEYFFKEYKQDGGD